MISSRGRRLWAGEAALHDAVCVGHAQQIIENLRIDGIECAFPKASVSCFGPYCAPGVAVYQEFRERMLTLSVAGVDSKNPPVIVKLGGGALERFLRAHIIKVVQQPDSDDKVEAAEVSEQGGVPDQKLAAVAVHTLRFFDLAWVRIDACVVAVGKIMQHFTAATSQIQYALPGMRLNQIPSQPVPSRVTGEKILDQSVYARDGDQPIETACHLAQSNTFQKAGVGSDRCPDSSTFVPDAAACPELREPEVRR